MTEIEIWKQVPSNPNYEVSNKGNIRHIVNRKNLKQDLSGRVSLGSNYNRGSVGKIVADVFFGYSGSIHHKNGNPRDNNVKNICCKNCNGKLSAADVRQIKHLLISGEKYDKLAARFGVNKSTISDIRHQRLHKEVHVAEFRDFAERKKR